MLCHIEAVLILVLVEDGLEAYVVSSDYGLSACVLILVLVEDGLEDKKNESDRKFD